MEIQLSDDVFLGTNDTSYLLIKKGKTEKGGDKQDILGYFATIPAALGFHLNYHLRKSDASNWDELIAELKEVKGTLKEIHAKLMEV